jgi:kumamolisin
LLAASTDLGPSTARDVAVLVTLPRTARPVSLTRWAATRGLRVQWQRGDDWATVTGPAHAMGAGFDVAIEDFRSRTGKQFYATRRQASVPTALRSAVTGVGTILSYVPRVTRALPILPADVPSGGLSAKQLLTVYNATPLANQGYTGKGKTIVFFEIDGFKQADLDSFSRSDGLARFVPSMNTEQPGAAGGETPMDLEVAHAIVPDAKLVVFDARLHATSIATAAAENAAMYQKVDKAYPGAIWSLSLGLRCETLFSPADLAPMQSAVAQAEAHGTSAFVSSGDTGGLECKGGKDFGGPPTQADIGLNAYSGLPAMTVVGGTALSTDAQGHWVAETAWTEPALQQGTSGGPSSKFPRPAWQKAPGMDTLPDSNHRLTPDVAADADPATGVRIVVNGAPQEGGGTSQAAPIWAGFAVMMNQYLAANGGRPLGNINPLLYQAAASTPAAFHDVTLGGNAVDLAQKHFDYVTGLGSPNVALLAGALLQAQKGGS